MSVPSVNGTIIILLAKDNGLSGIAENIFSTVLRVGS